MNRIDRLTAILTQLQSKRAVKAQEIADRFQISLRTVYRDMRSLEEAGIPITGEAGVGYTLVEGYRLAPVQFSKEEVVSLLIAEKIIEKFTDRESSRHFQSAMYKIKSLLNSGQKDRVANLSEQIAVISNPHKDREQTLQSLLNALLESKNVQLKYTSFLEEETTDRVIEPVGVYHAYGKWYLIGWCLLRLAYRTFRLDRVQSVTLLDTMRSRNHPSLSEYLDQVAKDQLLERVVLSVERKNAKYLREMRYHHGFVMEEITGKTVQMTFMTSSLEGLARWILTVADYVDVLEPEPLTELLRDLLKNMLLRLSKTPSNKRK
ncbi:transcriptional regulator, putative [Lunatimonas lonarensis]|uniref:Transcriptional regulator, putative n=1 Tax=Lunatimonas lonarensis TaxID=1232681 RepID=R7ZV28_9BACT|nr:YafY family protein [Lunatimonas lonarensis]EON77996.1 transcriptional regulator, putative [Lunatimonas lonarensis]